MWLAAVVLIRIALGKALASITAVASFCLLWPFWRLSLPFFFPLPSLLWLFSSLVFLLLAMSFSLEVILHDSEKDRSRVLRQTERGRKTSHMQFLPKPSQAPWRRKRGSNSEFRGKIRVLDGKEAITLISFIIREGLLTLLYDLITLWPCVSDFPTVTMFLSVDKICLIAPFSWISIPAHAGVWEAFLRDCAPLGHPKSPALMGLRLKKLNIQLLLSYSFLFDAEEQLGRIWRSCKREVDSDPALWLPWDWQLIF